MSLSDVPHQKDETYFADTENAAEMARLVRQARTLTRLLGSVFPQEIDITSIYSVLDVACGPGAWVLDVAQAYPHMQITGIDVSDLMINYASSMAAVEERQNVHFRVMNATHPLDFPDSSFDLVNARLIFGFMQPATWPKLLRECYRILRPGGIIVLAEGELPLTTSLAFERMSTLFAQALKKVSQSFSPDGEHIGITPVLSRLVRDAGFQQVQQSVQSFDMSAGTDLHREYFYPNFVSAFKLDQPFLVRAGVTTQENVERIYSQMLEEICANNFGAISYGIIVLGKKPQEAVSTE